MSEIERMSIQYYNWGYVSGEAHRVKEWIERYENYSNRQYRERRDNPLLAELEGIELQSYDKI